MMIKILLLSCHFSYHIALPTRNENRILECNVPIKVALCNELNILTDC